MRLAAMLVCGTLLLGTACSGDDDPALSIDDLRDTGSTCPIDVGQALDDAGVEVETVGDIEVEVEDGSKADNDTPLAQLHGIYVECTQLLEGGERGGDDRASLSVQFLAGDEGAVNAFLPQIQRDLELAISDLDSVVETIAETDTGTLAELPGDASAAIATVDIGDAKSTALYVDSDVLSRDDVGAIADAVIDQL